MPCEYGGAIGSRCDLQRRRRNGAFVAEQRGNLRRCRGERRDWPYWMTPLNGPGNTCSTSCTHADIAAKC